MYYGLIAILINLNIEQVGFVASPLINRFLELRSKCSNLKPSWKTSLPVPPRCAVAMHAESLS